MFTYCNHNYYLCDYFKRLEKYGHIKSRRKYRVFTLQLDNSFAKENEKGVGHFGYYTYAICAFGNTQKTF